MNIVSSKIYIEPLYDSKFFTFAFISENKEILYYSKNRILDDLVENFLIFFTNLNYYYELNNIKTEKIPSHSVEFIKSSNIKKNIFKEIKNFRKNKKYRKYTLCLVQKQNQILLGMKKKGFGEGYYNGFGGKVQENEKILDAAKRELYEESGLVAKNIKKTGKIFFNFTNSNEGIDGTVFHVEEFEGNPIETYEMIPQWFFLPEKVDFDSISELHKKLPFKKMWEDDLFWIPYFLRNLYFLCFFELNDQNKVVSLKILLKDKT